MIKTEKVVVSSWEFSDENKAEVIKVLPKILSKAFLLGYNSIEDYFDSLNGDGDEEIIYTLDSFVDFIKNEEEYIDVYETVEDDTYTSERYVGRKIIDFIIDYERNNHIKPDVSMLSESSALYEFFDERDLTKALVDFLKDKPDSFKEEVIEFFRNY